MIDSVNIRVWQVGSCSCEDVKLGDSMVTVGWFAAGTICYISTSRQRLT